MTLVAIVPSYDRPRSLAATLAGLEQHVRPDATLVLEQPRGAPLGSGEARRRLCERALEEHGPEGIILSLDDDCRFVPGECDVRWAAELFGDPRVGIVQLVNRRGVPGDKQRARPYLFHCYLIRGALIAEGLTYEPAEYADEVALSLRAWLAGWTLRVTQRARILHRVTSRGQRDPAGGGIEAAYLDGLVPVHSTFCERFVDTGLVVCREGTRDGVRLPTPYASIRVTRRAREAHASAARARGWAP